MIKLEKEKKILELYQKLKSANIDTDNLVYIPLVPMVVGNYEFVLSRVRGIKVAELITAPQD